jgi:hypothetical protein
VKAFVRFILLFGAFDAAASVAAGQVNVSAHVDTSRPVYEGEEFSYYVVIDGESEPGTVDLKPLSAYRPQAVEGTRQHVSVENGRISRRCIMEFMLTAPEAGVLRLPPVKVTVKGREYTTNPVQVSVVKAGSTEKVDVEVELGTTRCYVGQPVTLTVRWFVWAAEYNNMGNMSLNVPFFEGDLFTIEDTPEGAQTQKTHRINGQPVTLYQRRTRHKDVDSVEVFFSKVLIPRRAGTFRLEPVSAHINLAVGSTSSRRYDPLGGFFDSPFFERRQYQRFAARSAPVTLEVLPLPAEGRPADFSGLVGRYTIEAAATPTAVNVGDPITLTIRIGGSAYLKLVVQPDLALLPAFTDNFRISEERDSGTVEGGFKVFKQMLRATHEGVEEIPAIPLNFFDVEKGRYVTVFSEPIKLDVAATRILTEGDIQGANFTVIGRSVEAAQTGLSAHFEGMQALENQAFSPVAALIAPGYALLWGGPLVLLAASGIARLTMRNTPEKIAAARRRTALRNALRAARAAGRQSGAQACELLAAAMKQYAADRFNRSAKSLTAVDCYELIAPWNADAAAAYRDLIERCEAATYSGTQVNETVDMKNAIELMRTIERGIR